MSAGIADGSGATARDDGRWAQGLRLADLAALAGCSDTPAPGVPALEALARQVRARPSLASRLVGDARAVWWLDPRRLPQLKGQLTPRCRGALERAGIADDPDRLARLTAQAALAVRGLGWRSLVDLILAEERVAAGGPPVAAPGPPAPRRGENDRDRARALARRVLADPDSARFPLRDPRLAEPSAPAGASLADLARSLLQARTPGQGRTWTQAAQRLARCLEAMAVWQGLSLTQELAAVVAAVAPSQRDAAIVLRRYGLDGEEPEALAAIGQRHRLTRERVRQIAAQWAQRQRHLPAYTPVTAAVARYLAGAAPVSAAEATRALEAQGLVAGPVSPRTLENALRLLARDAPRIELRRVGGALFFVRPDEGEGWPPRVFGFVREALRRANVASVAEVVSRMAAAGSPVGPEAVASVVEAQRGIRWIHREMGYFWDPASPRQPVLRRVVKLLAVAGPLPPSALQRALSRERRLRGLRLPEPVVRLMALRAPGVTEGADGRLSLAPPLDGAKLMSPAEQLMSQVLAANGGVLHRSRFHRSCVTERGIRPATFEAVLGGMLFQVTAGVCTFAGCDPGPEAIARARDDRIARGRAARRPAIPR